MLLLFYARLVYHPNITILTKFSKGGHLKMLQKLKERKGQDGFTIIEVLIVLAIAGLIMLVVFLAVPALQRNSRNTQRNNDVASIVGAMNEYINNSGGQLPASCTGATPCAFLANAKLGYFAADTNTNFVYTRNASATAVVAPTNIENIAVGSFSTCNSTGTAASTTNATSRSVAIVYLVETGSGTQAQCKTIQ
jgi:prepilin-type N-terminal cleavage/methylation domain-containing protein